MEEGVKQGVKLGTFGLGELENGNPVCRFFKEDAVVSFSEDEILVKDNVCVAQRLAPGTTTAEIPVGPFEPGKGEAEWSKPPEVTEKVMTELTLKFGIPRGKVSQIMGVLNFLQNKYHSLDMEITAREGSMSEKEYSEKVKEALRQLGIHIE